MSSVRLALIRALDWLDEHVIEHRCYRLCAWIAWHPWWGD